MVMKKLIILNILVLFSVIATLVLSLSNVSRQLIRDETLSAYQNNMDVGYGALDSVFDNAMRLSLNICTDRDLQQAVLESEFRSSSWRNQENLLLMDNLLREYSGQSSYLSASFLPYDGEMVYRYHYQAGLWVTAQELLEEPWVKEAIGAGGGFIYHTQSDKDGKYIRLAKLMYNMEDFNQAIGIVCVDIQLEHVEPLVDSLALGQAGRGMLLDREGNVVLPYGQQMPLPELADVRGKSYRELENGDMVFSESYPLNGWRLAGIYSNREILDKTRRVNQTIVTTGILFGILSMGITLSVSRSIFRPITALADTMAAQEHNALPAPLEIPQNQGEITTLYVSFNQMIARIQTLIGEIYRAKEREQQAEMMALQAQINPHFLYNTLDSINWMAMKYGASDIQAMIVSLSRMLRFSLSSREAMITVEDELEQVKQYLRIMDIRYPGTLEVDIQVDEALLDCEIVKLVVQPLVENAILHGFSDLEETRQRGKLAITGTLGEQAMDFRVANNGKPADFEKIEALLSMGDAEPSKSYGIRNVHYRLQKHYGKGFGLYYTQEEEYTVASFSIPLEPVHQQLEEMDETV